jgi:hypothetical protein
MGNVLESVCCAKMNDESIGAEIEYPIKPIRKTFAPY